MLIPFLMFSLDSDQGNVKYSPLYGRGSKVTILVGRHFQSEMLPIARSSKKNLVVTHFYEKIFKLIKNCPFLAGLPYTPHGQFYDSAPTGGTKPTPY